MPAELVTGDYRELPITLYKDGSLFTIPSGATVKVGLRFKNNSLITPVTSSEAHPEADWPNGKLIAVFTKTDTENLTVTGDQISAQIEVQVESVVDQPMTWLVSKRISIIQGTVD